MTSRQAIITAKVILNHYYPNRKWKGRTVGIRYLGNNLEEFLLIMTSEGFKFKVKVTETVKKNSFIVDIAGYKRGLPYYKYTVTNGSIVS